MKMRVVAMGILGAVAGIAVATVAPWRQPISLHRAAPGTSHLVAYGVRGAPGAALSPKLDSTLADISRHLSEVRSDRAVQDLHVIHPAARFSQTAGAAEPSVLIDAVTLGDPLKLRASLEALGLERSAQFRNDVSGWLPLSQLGAATARAEVHAIRAAMPRKRSGAVTSQGDYVIHADTVRSANSLDGSGVTVGILSDSYNCYPVYAANGVPAGGLNGYANNGFNTTAPQDVTSGDLPSGVSILEEATCMQYNPPLQLPFGDEGRAMMQIVHDVAPGAGLAFYTAENGEADFASGIIALANAGAKIIADDVGYPDEPFFQDGLVAVAVNEVQAAGVTYFSAAGNDGDLAYDSILPKFSATQTSGVNAGERLLIFDQAAGGTATALPVTVPALIPGEFVVIVAEWDQPYVTGTLNTAHSPGSSSSIDLCVANLSGNSDSVYDGVLNVLSGRCSGGSTLAHDPVQLIVVGNPANATGNSVQTTFNVVVGLVAGGAVPGRIKVVVEDDGAGSTINAYATHGGTIQGHPGAAGAAAVGAAYYYNTTACGDALAELEPYSSKGGDPILFDDNGVRLPTPVTRQKPDFVGPDGANDTFLGFTVAGSVIDGVTIGSSGLITGASASCQNHPNFPNFFGTSAATPHVAATAALMLQADPALTTQVVTILAQSAQSMSDGTAATGAYYTGAGFVQADTAATMVPVIAPAAPSLSLSNVSITVGGSSTLTWSSANTTGCTASGSWSGAVASNGSQTVTPSAVGSDTYSLVCSNTAGMSPMASATLTVSAAAAASSGHSGGGAVDVVAIGGLLVLAVRRFRKRRLHASQPH